jgi:ABC-type nitrate/sulfonate/bicarbonate transport system permease component
MCCSRFGQTFLEVAWASLLLVVIGIPLGMLLYRYRLVRLATESWVGALAAAPIVLMYPLFLVIFGRSTTTIVMIGFAAGLAPVILKTLEGLAGTRQVLLNVGRSFKLTTAQQFRMILLPAALPTMFRRRAARPDLRNDQYRRRRIPDQLRRAWPADQRAR